MVIENKYLRKAIHKAGYVVIVKKYHVAKKNSKLTYISPNAAVLGMNVEMLNKGMKLTEDYIFPEDRQKVIQTVYDAIDAKLDDYVHEYRMVGDDGSLYHVSSEICIADKDDENVTVEFYLRDITEEDADKLLRYKSKDEVNTQRKLSEAAEPIVSSEEDSKLEVIMETVAKLTGLYSVFVSIDGRIVFKPTGPATNLGDFYDLFEKPTYKEYYKNIKQMMLEKNEPMILDREEGGLGKISPAPIVVENEVRGFWILGSYTAAESEKLREICGDQWKIARFISDYLYRCKVGETEIAKSRGAGLKLREELARQSIVNEALNKINSKISDSVDQVIDETIREVGLHMEINKVLLYTFGGPDEDEYSLRNYWDVSGEAPGDELTDMLPGRMYKIEDEINKGDGTYYIDNTNITEKTKLSLMRYNFKAAIAYPIYMNEKLYGIVLFAESKAERVWTKEELRFAQSISLLIQNMIENAEGDDNVRNVNKHLIETYNNFKVGIFVRDAHSGKVLFSNNEMNKMLGYDFTGGDSRAVLTDLHDRFDNIVGMRKPFVTKGKVTNWRSYIQVLDNIMDITEIQIEWLKGEKASLIILRNAKDF